MPRNPVYHYEAVQDSTLYAITMTSADTEYSQLLPDGTKKFEFRCRTAYDIRYAFITAKVAAPTDPYKSLLSGEVKSERNLNLSDKTLYVACGTSGQIVELEVWV